MDIDHVFLIIGVLGTIVLAISLFPLILMGFSQERKDAYVKTLATRSLPNTSH